MNPLHLAHHKIWITRPTQDAFPHIQQLESLGIKTVAYPLLYVRFSDTQALDLGVWHDMQCQAVVFTSANGVRAFANIHPERHIPVYAVGQATATQADTVGFHTIHTAQGDIISLADTIKQSLSPHDGYICHPTSSVVARDLGALLGDVGYRVRRHVIYTVDAVDTLPHTICDGLHDGTIGGVVIMSPRTARIFVDMVHCHKICLHKIRPKTLHVFCLSKAIADIVHCLGDTLCVHISDYPVFSHILRHIKREYALHDENT